MEFEVKNQPSNRLLTAASSVSSDRFQMGLTDEVRTVKRPRKLNRIGPSEEGYNSASGVSIGQRLVRRRLELQLTQAAVAAAVSFQFKSGKRQHVETPLSRNAYCMYELGKVEPSLKTIVGLAHVLRSSPEWLAFGTGRKSSSSSKRYPPEDISNGDARIRRTL